MIATEKKSSSPFSYAFIRSLPSITEPNINALPHTSETGCFPFFLWKRKSDLESGEYKAQNQLGLPVIKCLDMLRGVGRLDIPVFGLVTIGSQWEIFIAYNTVSQGEVKVCRSIVF